MGRRRHLVEERLFDCYVAQRGGESIEPPAADHLADCGECAARYAELAQFMDGLRADMAADAGMVRAMATSTSISSWHGRAVRRVRVRARPSTLE